MSSGAYEISILPAARKQLDRLPGSDRSRLDEAIASLAENPRPPGCVKLHGEEAWRIRVGVYRVIYEIHDDVLLITIIRVAHRKDSYRP